MSWRRIVRFHRNVGPWTIMLTKESPVPNGSLYQYGQGHHPSHTLVWWRR